MADVLVAGTVLRVKLASRGVGDRVDLSLRPETLRLLGVGESPPPGWAALSGMLEDVDYLGPVTRFLMRIADGTHLHGMTIAPPAVSGPITVAFDPAQAVILEARA